MDLLLSQPTPRSSYTLQDLRDRVRGDLASRGVTAGSSSFFTDDDIRRWGNEAQDKIATATHWFYGLAVMGTTSGQAEYNLPLRVISIESVRFNGNALAVTNVNQLSQINYNWRRVGTGTPTRYYARGGSAFGLFLIPGTTASDNLEVRFNAIPPPIVADQDNFYIPYGYDHLIVTWAKKRASEKDSYGEGARRIQSLELEWREGINEIKYNVNSLVEGDICAMGENALYSRSSFPAPVFTINQYSAITKS